MQNIKNALVVGGGLAGICLTHQLQKRNINLKLIDIGENYSSRIAAGMINPMVFRTMVKTWMGDILIPYLDEFYPEIEAKTGEKFFFKRKIRRVFSTKDEREKWLEREHDPAYENYIFSTKKSDTEPSYIKSSFGSGIVNSPGYIDAEKFMKANHDFFLQEGVLQYEAFNFSELDVKAGKYKDTSYDAIIFSEGYLGKNNPYFNYLPLQQTKGEVLTIDSNQLEKNEILNRKCFILPTEDGLFRLGATFSWNTTDTTPTKEAKEKLLEQYNGISTATIKVIDQKGGIRPTVTDRRPLIGAHPKWQNLYIFNGMGTKGYMIAPYFSHHFVRHLLDGESLDREVDISRFKKKHYKPL